MNFVWFWSFWHWSKESFRDGSLLRNPLHGVGGHWDEWFRHEASENDRAAIAKTGRDEASQRRFISWLLVHWARETDLRENRLARRFVLAQIALAQPFKEWVAFEQYRTNRGLGGISAVVLGEGSPGKPEDVRQVEALALPMDTTAPAVVSEGFQADSFELETPRAAAARLLSGSGLLIFFVLWLAGGKRPYPRWLQLVLGLGWLAVGGLILYLLMGPDPADRLPLLTGALAALWIGLVMTAIATATTLGMSAWRQGRRLSARLEQSQVRLRMSGGLTLKGGSAALPFCLNMLVSIYRAEGRLARRSWLWRRLFEGIGARAGTWAATGAITPGGFLKPVVLESKLRACLKHDGIQRILTPRQPGVTSRSLARLAGTLAPSSSEAAAAPSNSSGVRFGFAAEEDCLSVHPCRHIAQAQMRLGGFNSPAQMAMNVFALAVSVTLLVALPDLRGILLPPAAPAASAPSSPSPEYLWVNLETKHPENFLVAMESHYWLNRRVEVVPRSAAGGSGRAEIRLQRSEAPENNDQEDGVVWIERRHWFLGREFAPGERVGRYSLSYLSRLGHE